MSLNQVHAYGAQLPDAGHARRIVAAAVDGVGPAVLEDILLLVSELVTNALLHAHTSVELHVTVEASRVRIAVRDSSTLLPALRRPDPLDPGGRGLQIVRALADRWGVKREPNGKVVWCELSLSEPSEPETAGSTAGSSLRHARLRRHGPRGPGSGRGEEVARAGLGGCFAATASSSGRPSGESRRYSRAR